MVDIPERNVRFSDMTYTRTGGIAKKRVKSEFGRIVDMVTSQERQAARLTEDLETHGKIQQVYGRAREDLLTLQNATIQQVPKRGTELLDKREVKDLKKLLKKATKESMKIIREAQVKAAAKLATEGVGNEAHRQKLESQVETLARGGIKAWLLHLPWIGSKRAVKAFKSAKSRMEAVAFKPIERIEGESLVDRDIRTEFNNSPTAALSRRVGVVGYNGIYRLQRTFDKKKLHKQFKQHMAQQLGETKVRTTMSKKVKVGGKNYDSRLTPLNQEFSQLKGVTSFFGRLMGDKGISAANRKERHLINGWETEQKGKDGKPIFLGIRHAIMSDKYEKSKEIRRQAARQMAKELLHAAFIQELKRRGLTPDLASRQGLPIKINFSSVSLVTPDVLRKYFPGANERQLLKDQIDALRELDGEQELVLDGHRIRADFNIMAFNYGVNAGAVGRLKLPMALMGHGRQHEYNKRSLEKLGRLVNDFNAHKQEFRDKLKDMPDGADKTLAQLDLEEQVNKLWVDIQHLNRNKYAYIKEGNQYEVGAKILLLMNLLDRAVLPDDALSRSTFGGSKCAFNCMSGKDRAGYMDAMARTFAMMGDINGEIPTHQQLKESRELRLQFVRILVPMLKQYGGLDITEINTDVKGYKVNKEAQIWGILGEDFEDIRALSPTTGA